MQMGRWQVAWQRHLVLLACAFYDQYALSAREAARTWACPSVGDSVNYQTWQTKGNPVIRTLSFFLLLLSPGCCGLPPNPD